MSRIRFLEDQHFRGRIFHFDLDRRRQRCVGTGIHQNRRSGNR